MLGVKRVMVILLIIMAVLISYELGKLHAKQPHIWYVLKHNCPGEVGPRYSKTTETFLQCIQRENAR